MSTKLVIVGALVFYVVTFLVALATGPIIHEGILDADYAAHEEFWRPPLREDPPDMAALMPRWIASGLITSLILATIYGCVRKAFDGPGWKKGLWYGLILSGFGACWALGYSGLFNLPDKIWLWWAFEGFLYYLPGGAALGWVAQKVDPE